MRNLSTYSILAAIWMIGAPQIATAQGGPVGDVTRSFDFNPIKVLQVDAATPWTASGMMVQSGERLTIIAKGQATTVLSPTEVIFTGPEGFGGLEPHPNHPVPDAAQWSLIAKIGSNGDPFYVGGAITITSDVSGELYFGYNDTVFWDNAGNFVVYVVPISILTSAVDVDGPARGSDVMAAPNPFSEDTRIVFSVKNDGLVRVDVFDISGRLVSTLLNGEVGRGSYSVTWNGRDETGTAVPSGQYFARIEVQGDVRTQKIIFIQ